jgi:uncharacterized protein (TIGR03435 family)
MKKLLFGILAFTAFCGSSLLAQSLVGNWQGTLAPPPGAPPTAKELRIVMKVTTTDGEMLKAALYSIDQGAQAIPGGAVTVQGKAVKITVPGIGGTYEGTFSADGNAIAGTWTQGPAPVPLNLVRATQQTAWAIPEPPPRPKPMAADANPVFEVATIKPSNPDARGMGYRVNGRSFSTLNTTLSNLITFAYGIHARQVIGAPEWVDKEKFDISAKPDGEGQPNDAQWKMMVQKLLTDRFKLTFQRDKKELSVYALTVAKTGPKMTQSAGDPNGLPGLNFRGLGALAVINANMSDFTQLMQGAVLDRPVVDQTGIKGRWDFTLNWTPDEFQFAGMGVKPPPPPADSPNPDLFTAIQQQIGLKLDSTKATTEVFVVDHVDKPSEN